MSTQRNGRLGAMTTIGELNRGAKAIVDRVRSVNLTAQLSILSVRASQHSTTTAALTQALTFLRWEPTSLSKRERSLFEKLGGDSITNAAASVLRQKAHEASIDPRAVQQLLTRAQADVDKAYAAALAVLSVTQDEDTNEDDGALGFRFARGSALETLSELQTAAKQIDNLARLAYRIRGKNPPETKLASVDRGSVIVHIIIDVDAIDAFSKIAGAAVGVAGVRMMFEKIRREATDRRVSNLINAMDKAEKVELKERLEEEVEKALLGCPADNNEKNEIRKLMLASVGWFAGWLAKGGRMVHRALNRPSDDLQRRINEAVDNEADSLGAPKPTARLEADNEVDDEDPPHESGT